MFTVNHVLLFCYHTVDLPNMTGDPIFIGPVTVQRESDLCVRPPATTGYYNDFYLECQVQYPNQTVDDGARFNVSLTFDGKTDPDNPDTHQITDGTALNVRFQSMALKGNIGKSVNIYLAVSFCGHIKENRHRIEF